MLIIVLFYPSRRLHFFPFQLSFKKKNHHDGQKRKIAQILDICWTGTIHTQTLKKGSRMKI